LFNIFNSLRVILDNHDFLLEGLRDHTSQDEARDLVQLLQAA
jgi:hypothetical protein